MRYQSETGEELLLNNISVRVRFAKLGRAKYISHLDLIRCFQRAVCRAGLPAAYSAGFHPHM
ncbi:TIGR03936 family radical SAM-associated protein, partial [Ruminococcus sp. CAG:330]|uniref:TIGR03936 family radical SAM-associated protein n=1 Tax=Ruminococcus sp. CAG:330 TaxID=1262954 RepID=UPI0034E98511